MGISGSAPDATVEGVRRVFSAQAEPHAPLAASEVAEAVASSDAEARELLDELREGGELRTRRIAGGQRVWWADGAEAASPAEPQSAEFGAFVSAVEDYAIFTLDPDGVVASWNEGARRIKGYSEEEIVGQHFSAFYTEEDVADGVPERNVETALAEGRVVDEGWRVRADGSRFWANVTITAIRDDDGTLLGFTKVTRDMTEQREYEQRLRRERDFSERVLETVPVSVFVADEDGEIVRTNDRVLDRLGVDDPESVEFGVDRWEIYDEDGAVIPADEWPWLRVLETGEPVHGYECQIDLPDIGRRWLSIDATLLADADATDADATDADATDAGEDRVVFVVEDVTERKQRERQLRREYEQTEKLLRTAPIAIAVQDAEGTTVMANRRAQETLGLSEEELIDRDGRSDDWELLDERGEPVAPSETPSARVLRTGEPVYGEEVTIVPLEGERIHLRLNAVPVFGDDESIERVITTGEDLTELKRRERQLERRRDELETELGVILGRISDAFYALDDEWRFTHLNDVAAEILQLPREELLGREVWDVFPESEGGVFWEEFHAAMETQEPVSFEYFADDIGSWLEFTAYPSESGLSIYFHDVTERKARERALTKYETIVETVDDGIYVKDDDGIFTMVNDAYAELTGYETSELVGSHASLVVDESTIEAAKQKHGASVEDDGNPTMEAMIERGDGERVPTEGTFATIGTDDGNAEQVGVVRDISDRKEYERKLEASNERLEQFAYAASHDLQEPLRMVSSYLQLIEQRYADELDEDGREFIEFAVDGATRMRDMIDGLLEYSRIDTRGDPFELVELDSVVADVLEDLRVRIEETDAEVTTESLPKVHGDAGQLRQVFQNLLDNAIEYSGDDPPRVHVSAERAGDEWAISVRDEGIGIDAADTDRVFEVFQSLDGSGEHSGTGIGLAICRRIVERHGGEIRVESVRSEGSTFSFTLPAYD